MSSEPQGTWQEKKHPREAVRYETDAHVYEVVRQYLTGLLPDLNLRLFCDAELAPGRFPQRILWVEEITVLKAEAGTWDCDHEEKYCQEERDPHEGQESAFSGRIKYIAEKIKNSFMTLWKKKGR